MKLVVKPEAVCFGEHWLERGEHHRMLAHQPEEVHVASLIGDRVDTIHKDLY